MKKNKSHEAQEKFICANSIVNNHLPPAISTEGYINRFGEIAEVNFGFFDAASPDYTTFFPEITNEDLEPKEEDYYMPLVRALSEVVVNKWGPIDFSEKGVLEASTILLPRQTLYANHEVMVGNEVGVVFDAVFQQALKTGNTLIPAGINARLKIDTKLNPRLVRGMKMDPPSVHSTSVGVTFIWEKSHADMDDSEFWNKLGSYDKKGKLIRRVVKEIKQYNELSLVPHGADPYAQIINEKGLNNIDYAKRADQYRGAKLSLGLTKEDFKKHAHYINYSDNTELSINLESSNQDKPNKNKFMELEQFIEGLESLNTLGFKKGASDEDSLKAALTAIKKLIGDSETLKKDLKEANAVKDTHEALIASEKAEAIRLYKLAKGDAASKDMEQIIEKLSTLKEVQLMKDQYTQEADGNFRQSSEEEEEEQENSDDPKNQNQKLNSEEAFAALRKKKLKPFSPQN